MKKYMETNARVFHVTQHTVLGFPSLRNKWIFEIFRDQLYRKSMLFNVEILNYTVMTNHYHLELLYNDQNGRKNFMKCFVRDFCKKTLAAIRSRKKINPDLKFEGNKVFTERPHYEAVYSIKHFFWTFRYVYNNPINSDPEIELRKHSFTGGKEISSGFVDLLNIDILKTLWANEDLGKLLAACELEEREFYNFLERNFSMWTDKNNFLVFKMDEAKDWDNKEEKKEESQKTSFHMKVSKTNIPKNQALF